MLLNYDVTKRSVDYKT